MPRTARHAPGGYVYHVLNRAVARLPLFEKAADYVAFETVLALTYERFPIRMLAYGIIPNHWHMGLWPREDGELTAFVRWLTHAMRIGDLARPHCKPARHAIHPPTARQTA